MRAVFNPPDDPDGVDSSEAGLATNSIFSDGLDVEDPIYRYGRNFLGTPLPVPNGKTDA
jgi:hypothetical protein